MKIPPLDSETKRFYETILPTRVSVETRAMFGGLGTFFQGNIFAGAIGTKVFLRLPERERFQLLREPGGGPIEPIKGRPMVEYATVPDAWRDDPDRVREWVARSLAFVAKMPPKKPSRKGGKRQGL